MVQGTPRPDRILIAPTDQAGIFRVTINGRGQENLVPAAAIDVDAAGGNDTIVVDPRVTVPTRLDGGEGNDQIRGGSGPNDLNGGSGRNTLIGNPARDTFDNASGRNRLVFVRSLGAIQVGPSASGSALRSLAGPFALRPLQVTGPAVVGAADLGDGRIADLLKNDFEAGQPVAITNATAADASTLAAIIGYAGQVALPDGMSRADLITFRKVQQDGRTLYSISILPPGTNAPAVPGRRLATAQANAQVIRASLANVFTTTPTMPAAPAADDPQANLINLANAYQYVLQPKPNANGDYIQIVNTVYGVRSFDNAKDLFYVLQEIDYYNAQSANQQILPPSIGGNRVYFTNHAKNVISENRIPTTLQPSPQSNPGTTSVTSGVSLALNGGLGYNQAQGFNASVGGSLTISNSETTTFPPIVITYQGNPAVASTEWTYQFAPHGSAVPSETTTTYNQWIWEVPFAAYTPDQTTLEFSTEADLNYTVFYGSIPPQSYNQYSFNANLVSTVPLPFGDTRQILAPRVTGVSTPMVRPGDTFTIEGQALYPSLVQSVLIGGTPLSSANYKTISDTKIQVVAPNTLGTGLPIVVQTSKGYSNDTTRINISTSEISVQVPPLDVAAGQAFNDRTVANFTDPDPGADPSNLSAVITWGDGSTSPGRVFRVNGPGSFAVLGSHTYTAAGSYPLGVQVTARDGSQASASAIATVTGAAAGGPQNLVAQPVSAVAGRAFTNVTLGTFTDSDPGASPSDFTASIDWGDGISTPITTVALAGPKTFSVLGTHTYVAPGTYPLGIRVTDGRGRATAANGSVTVA